MRRKRLPISGQCFCGRVKFEARQAPSSACHCHCESCQRASGAPFVTWVAFPVAGFRITGGALVERLSSPGTTRGHCAQCGTTMTYRSERFPDEIDVAATCLDQPGAIKPDKHIWLEDKQPWVTLNDELPKYNRWSRDD